MAQEHTARAAIAGISSMAMRPILALLAARYECETGRCVTIVSVGGVEASLRVRAGETFDFAVLASDAIERLAADGLVDPESRVDVARSGVAVAVAVGATHPEIGSEAALRDAILRAGRIGISTGPSGNALLHLFERWGIAREMAARVVQAAPGVPVGALIANGEVELGFQQLSELMTMPGVDIVGPLPPEIHAVTVFSGAICATSRRRDETLRFLAWLTSGEADAAKCEHGMEPA
ncbi:Aconitate isomerase [Paraburkholderia caffeinitolerans]|uniref:Aconitate isomerase n=1 Tax=Paraburkholderia caffeinitolerans TaxID=1723730 RepID=A0A6J5FNS2_9BURK|nr:substrate-binding domain-containing protein [Paraburkholderia caffeinitolerans]CAB3783673.1 Aconitate isomerase [Paraburkholderia caffeinitolerans]